MSRKALVAVLLALLVGGLIVYVSSTRAPAEPPQVAAEDCEDKPPPSEFAMAAECEGDAAPAPGGAPAADLEGGARR